MSRVKVDFRGRQNRVSVEDAERQARTMRLILKKLSVQPGVVLCDEVGMGKTYVALGVIAQYLSSYRSSRVLILTPSADLAEKWIQDLERFRTENVRGPVQEAMRPRLRDCTQLHQLLGSKDKSRVWVLPLSVLLHSHRRIERTEFRRITYQLLSKAGNLSRLARKELWRRLGGRVGKGQRIPQFRRHLDWDGWRLPSMRNIVRVWLRKNSALPFVPGNISRYALKQLQDAIWWQLVKRRLRRFSLIVVDEAHHFKNPDSKRYRSLEGVFKNAFRDMLFLTATPFQLGPDELESILLLFELSCEPGARKMQIEVQAVVAAVRDYQECVQGFELTWRQLPQDAKHKVCSSVSGLRTGVAEFDKAHRELEVAHKRLQECLSKWVIRNVKDRDYRRSHEEPISLVRTSQLPFAVLQRLLHEYQRQQRTFSATQK